jgi:hypothetical protein
MRIQRPSRAHGAKAPHAAQQLLAREDPGGLCRQRPQQREFLLRELDRLAVQPHPATHRIHLQPTNPHSPHRRPAPGAPEQRADPGVELLIAERFHDIVVAAAVKSAEPVELAGPAGQD